MSSLETSLDELYQLPLGEFVAARGALAKTLSGDARARVARLEKPTIVPWAINQVYWHDRPLFDRAMKTGAALRAAQTSALGGRKADVRAATEAHRQALAAAVDRAAGRAEAAGAHPSRDALMRTLEALSLAAEPPGHPGRLTEALQPAGFEALAGISLPPPAAKPATVEAPAKPTGAARPAHRPSEPPPAPSIDSRRAAREAAAAEKQAERERAAEARRLEAETRKRRADLDRAREREAEAREAFERAVAEREEAERRLRELDRS